MFKEQPYFESFKDTSIYLPEVATLIKKKRMTLNDTLFEFELKDHPLGHLPGQFVEVSIPGIGEAPFSVTSPSSDFMNFELAIRSEGALTKALHSLKIGDKVGVRGPYGKPFPLDDLKGKNLLFIAGGLGLAPLRSAILDVLDRRDEYKDIIVLFGCQDPSQRLFISDLKTWKKRNDILFYETVDTTELSNYIELTHMDISYRETDDKGKPEEWNQNIGVITTLLPKLPAFDPSDTYAMIAGPPVMYKYVIMNLHDIGFHDTHIIVSLERRMKCGVGKCGHCQIGHLYVCKDGPVFYYSDISDISGAI